MCSVGEAPGMSLGTPDLRQQKIFGEKYGGPLFFFNQ